MLLEARVTYKNLKDVHVVFGDRTVVYGENGSGKSNLMEALALAAGSALTMTQIASPIHDSRVGGVGFVPRCCD